METVKMETVNVDLERVDCPSCGAITHYQNNFIEIKRRTGQKFSCPNGHEIIFPVGDNNIDSLKEKLKRAEEENTQLKREKIQLLSKLDQLEAEEEASKS